MAQSIKDDFRPAGRRRGSAPAVIRKRPRGTPTKRQDDHRGGFSRLESDTTPPSPRGRRDVRADFPHGKKKKSVFVNLSIDLINSY
jgi:hypothetical protein